MATIGYGDINPETKNEKIFAIFAMIAACACFSYIVGSISSIIDGNNPIIKDFE